MFFKNSADREEFFGLVNSLIVPESSPSEETRVQGQTLTVPHNSELAYDGMSGEEEVREREREGEGGRGEKRWLTSKQRCHCAEEENTCANHSRLTCH